MAALASTFALASSVAAEKPRLPDYESVTFESLKLRLVPLNPTIVAAARIDQPALLAWTAPDRGGFRQLHAKEFQRRRRARALIGGAVSAEIPRLVAQFDGEPAAFAFVTKDQREASRTSFGKTAPLGDGPGASPTREGLPEVGTPGAEARLGQPAPPVLPAVTPASIEVPSAVTVVPQPAHTALPSPPQLTPVPLPPPAPTPQPTATPIGSLVLTLYPPGPIVRGDNMRPGDSVVGTVTVGNDGTLPFLYAMSVKGGSGPLWDDRAHGLQLRVLRLSDNATLHSGPLAASTGPLDRLFPGEKEMLALQVSIPPSASDVMQGASVTVDFVFTAMPLP